MTLPVIFGGVYRKVRYLLNDSFNDTLAAGAVNGTNATPGPGTRVATETDGELSIGSGVLSFPAQTTPTWGDQGFHLSDAVTRAFGKMFFVTLNLTTWEECGFGFDNTAAPADPDSYENGLQANTTDGRIDDNGGIVIVTGLSTSTNYTFAIVLRAAGAYYFLKGGAYTNWTLIWIDGDGSTATLYTVFSNLDGVGTLDKWRVPQTLWTSLPCLCYDTFTAANGTSLDAHSSDTSGPDSQAVTARSWTEVIGDLDIQSNKANAASYVSNEVVAAANCGQADVVADISISLGQHATSDSGGIVLRESASTKFWLIDINSAVNKIIIYQQNSGYTNRAETAVTINQNTTYTVRAIADGQTIDGFVSGGNKVSYGSAAQDETVTNHGFRIGAVGAETNPCSADNFTVFARDSGYSVLDKYTG